MLQDYKLGLRMLLKFPGLTLAGGLALAIAIGLGTAWYDVVGKFLAPTIPLPGGDRLVTIETQNVQTNEPEARVMREFLEWRRELRTIESLGAFRAELRSLAVGDHAPERVRLAEITVAAFDAAGVPPLLGRGLLASDQQPGAPAVVLIGYSVWQRTFGGRADVVGSIVKLGNTPTTVVGVMPDGFAYPANYTMWTPLTLRASYAALEGDGIQVIGRLAAGATREQADAELRLLGERMAAASPATHQHLRPRVLPLGGTSAGMDVMTLVMRNLPVLIVLLIACVSVGTLVYARTAIREGEIAVRTALGASRGRIIGQLFVEALVLTLVAAAVGLVGASVAVRWVVESFEQSSGGVAFWITPDLRLSTMVYAVGLAVVTAVMLSLLPALKVTRANVQPHLANRGAGGSTLRFGHVWTTAMIVQVALTAMGIPGALELAREVTRNARIRAAFPSHDYLAARVGVDRTSDDATPQAFEARRARALGELQRRIAQEPGVMAIAVADNLPGSGSRSRSGRGHVESAGGGPTYSAAFETSTVDPRFFEMFDRPIVAGRGFRESDRSPSARTVVVNEAFVRELSRDAERGSPVGARLRYTASSSRPDTQAEPPYEIVGVVRNLGLTPDDMGEERPFVFHAATETVSPFVMNVRMRGGNPAGLAARLPAIAADVDATLFVEDSRSLDTWINGRAGGLDSTVVALTVINGLGLFLSSMSIFSLVSVSVSRRRRELGVRTALGAEPRHLVAGVVNRAVVLMGTGIAAGGATLLLAVALGIGPSGRPADDVPLFAGHLGVTSAIMLAACLLACIGPARRALGINPSEALKDA